MQQRITALSERRKEQVAGDLLPLFEQHLVEQDRSTNTIRGYLTALRDFLAWYESQEQKPLVLAALTPITLIGYRNALQHEQHKAASTVNQRVSTLKVWCAWLVENGYLASDPAARLKLIKAVASGDSRQGLTDPQVNALLRQAEQSRLPARNYAIVQLLLQTGLRVGEAVALTFDDITFGQRSGKILVRSGKGNKSREVPLNGSARKAIAELVAGRLEAREPTIEAVAHRWPRSGSAQARWPLFESQKGGHLTITAVEMMLTELVKAAGDLVPEGTHPHTLRHTFARNYLGQFPGDIAGLATILGHSSLDTTRLYGNPTTQQLAARVEGMNANAYE